MLLPVAGFILPYQPKCWKGLYRKAQLQMTRHVASNHCCMRKLVQAPKITMLVGTPATVMQICQHLRHWIGILSQGDDLFAGLGRDVNNVVLILADQSENSLAAIDSFADVVPVLSPLIPKAVHWP